MQQGPLAGDSKAFGWVAALLDHEGASCCYCWWGWCSCLRTCLGLCSVLLLLMLPIKSL
jgi:hypothetical protein